MDYLLILLVAILSFLVGYFVCQKRFKNNVSQENFDGAPIYPNGDLQKNAKSYALINKELMQENDDNVETFETFETMDNRNNTEPNMPGEQSEEQRLHKMMNLSGKDEIDNVKAFDEPLESYNDDNYASFN